MILMTTNDPPVNETRWAYCSPAAEINEYKGGVSITTDETIASTGLRVSEIGVLLFAGDSLTVSLLNIEILWNILY